MSFFGKLEGMIFSGRYRIIRLIGRGGTANVYLATDLSSGMNVAIKVLDPQLASSVEFVKRFDTEAKAAASLNHPNIVRVFGVGTEGKFRYMVQEYVDGITVKDLITQNGHLDWRVAVPIAMQVGMALSYAHANGIVHKDIKPHNILITRDRIAKVTDFGIARASMGNTITVTAGGTLGTVQYFSPEQARGALVGPLTDVYSLGVTLFEMITGRVPFDGENSVAIAVKHLQEPPPMASSFVPGVPAGLDAIIQKAMQKSTEYRYSSARAMVEELDALMVDPNGAYGVILQTGSDESTTGQQPSIRQEPNYGKLKDIEQSIGKRRRSRIKDNALVIGIVVVILGILIGVTYLLMDTLINKINIETSDTFMVENYVGMTIDEVQSKLKEHDFTSYKIDYEVRTDYAPNVVVDQSIAAGMEIKPNSGGPVLTLTVSQSLDSSILEDYAGQSYSDAYAALNALGYQHVTIRPETNDDVDEGIVLRTEPPAGSSVIPADDAIVIIYSQQNSEYKVPEIINMNLEQARVMIDEANLVLGQIEVSPTAEGLPESQLFVLLTDPLPGTVVPRKSAIKLYVGNAEDVIRGGTPTPTPEESTEFFVDIITMGNGYVEGGGLYKANAVVTIRAVPNIGYHFVSWVDAENHLISNSAEYSFVMPEGGVTIYARFDANVATATPTPTSTPTPTPTTVPITDPATTDPPQP